MSKREFYFDPKWISIVFFAILFGFLLIHELISGPIDHTPEVDFTSKEQIEIRFVDVGQGDCTIIRTSSGKGIIIDTGNKETETNILNAVSAMGISKIQYLILTHPHSDHTSSLDKIIDAVEVENIVYSNQDFGSILNKAKEKNINVNICKKREKLEIDGLEFIFLTDGSETKNPADGCIITAARYKNTSFLFTSDANRELEELLLNDHLIFNCDVIKVAHHGSSTSSSKEFITAFDPETAVISVGKDNGYAHPSKEVLERLESSCELVLRTDINGDVRIRSDGNAVKVFSEK